MFDDFLPVPDAESLPFYPLVLKLVVCARIHNHTRTCARAHTHTHTHVRAHTQVYQGGDLPAVIAALLELDPERRPDANALLASRPLRRRLAAFSRIHPAVLAEE